MYEASKVQHTADQICFASSTPSTPAQCKGISKDKLEEGLQLGQLATEQKLLLELQQLRVIQISLHHIWIRNIDGAKQAYSLIPYM